MTLFQTLFSPESDGLLVLIVPRAPKLPGLVPDLLHLRVVLDNDCVLEVGSRARVGAVSIKAIFCNKEDENLGQFIFNDVSTCVASCAAAVDGDVKVGVALAGLGGQVDTVEVAEVSLAEDDTVEGLVKLEGDLHQVLLTLDIEAGDLGHVLLGLRPHGVCLRSRGLDIGRGGLAGHSNIVRDVGLLGRLGLVALLGRLRSGLVLGLPGRSRLGDILRPLGRLGSRLVLRLGRRRSVLGLGLGLPLGRRRSGLRLVLRLLLGRRRWRRRLVLGLLGRRRPLLRWRRRLVLRLLRRLGLVLGLLRGGL